MGFLVLTNCHFFLEVNTTLTTVVNEFVKFCLLASHR